MGNKWWVGVGGYDARCVIYGLLSNSVEVYSKYIAKWQ